MYLILLISLIMLIYIILDRKECIGCDQPLVNISDYYRVVNSDVPSCTVKTIPNISESSCENMCDNDLGCKFYNYNLTSNDCFIKSPLINAGTNLGLKRQDNNFNIYQDSIIPGHMMDNMPIKNVTQQHCSSKCSYDKNCHWFTYNKYTKDCNLHKAYFSNDSVQAHKP